MTVVDDQPQIIEPEHFDDKSEVSVLSRETIIDNNGREYTRVRAHVEDESDQNPELRDEYREKGDWYEMLLRANPQLESTMSQNGVVEVPKANSAARWIYFDEYGKETQMIEWARAFPNAIALEPLQRLEEGGKWLSAGSLDERTLAFFTYMLDGIALRSRARIYNQLLVEHAHKVDVNELKILSLGSGAAVPNIQATQRLEKRGVGVHWNFYDYNPHALMFAQALIEEKDFQLSSFDYGPTKLNAVNGKIEPRGQHYKRAYLAEDESADVIDALGLWEYLDKSQAGDFISKLYPKLKSGGSMIVSNMLPSRPQLAFNQKAVGWPGLKLRDEEMLLDILVEAGIDSRLVTMTHSEDGVYVVMEIKKP